MTKLSAAALAAARSGNALGEQVKFDLLYDSRTVPVVVAARAGLASAAALQAHVQAALDAAFGGARAALNAARDIMASRISARSLGERRGSQP